MLNDFTLSPRQEDKVDDLINPKAVSKCGYWSQDYHRGRDGGLGERVKKWGFRKGWQA